MSDTEILIQALNAQLANPARAVVNFECSFVKDRLYASGHDNLARRYWSWVCSNWEANPIFGDRKSTRLNSSHVRTSRMPSSA